MSNELKEEKKKVGRPETDDKANPVTIYVKESYQKNHGGKKKFRKKLKKLSEDHLENNNNEQNN